MAMKILAKKKTPFEQLNAELQMMAEVDHLNLMHLIESFEGSAAITSSSHIVEGLT